MDILNSLKDNNLYYLFLILIITIGTVIIYFREYIKTILDSLFKRRPLSDKEIEQIINNIKNIISEFDKDNLKILLEKYDEEYYKEKFEFILEKLKNLVITSGRENTKIYKKEIEKLNESIKEIDYQVKTTAELLKSISDCLKESNKDMHSLDKNQALEKSNVEKILERIEAIDRTVNQIDNKLDLLFKKDVAF